MIINIPIDILEEVAEVNASAARTGVKVDWMDETLGRITTKMKHLELLDKTQALEDELVELDRRRDEISQILAEADAELMYNNLSHQRVTNYPVKVLRRRE